MKQKILFAFLLVITLSNISFALETEPQEITDAVKPESASQNLPLEGAAKMENVVNEEFTSPTELFSDQISKYDASLNESNIYDLIFPKENSLVLRKDYSAEGTDVVKPFFEAMERFSQSNVTVSYKNFEALIDNNNLNDFYYMTLAYQMSDLGFFSLSEKAMAKVENREVWQSHIETIKRMYLPKNKLSHEEELFLANIYTSIIFNNLTRESIQDVMKRDRLIRRSDYANYLVANALFIDKDYQKALSSINRSLSSNSENFYYINYKIKILIELERYEEALKLVSDLESKNILNPENIKDVEKQKYYLLSKSEKNEAKAKYYLANYFSLNNDYARAIKELIPISYKTKTAEIPSLLGDIYFKTKDYPKATESYERALDINKHCDSAYKGLANISMLRKEYSLAEKNYLKALKHNKYDENSLIGLSVINYLKNDQKIAKQYSDKALSVNPNCYKGYYLQSKYKQNKNISNLVSASILNPFFANTWLDLADNSLLNKDTISAEKYLDSVKYLEDNNFRYYYYKGIIARLNKDSQTADSNFIKAVSLYTEKTGKSENIPVSQIKEN